MSALDKVNETNGTARFLDGHGDSEFLTQEELDQFTPLDDTPTQGSEKGISSGKIFTYLDQIGKAIDNVNGVSSSSGGTSETIKEKLEYLNETKRAIRKEILDKGISISESTDFVDYAEKIGEIEMEANLDVQPLEVTENKVYEAPEGKAYNPVTVKVEFDMPVKTITKNGKYKAEDEGYDGYAEVDVSATSMLMTKEVSGEDFPAEIETLTYKAKDEGDDTIGYSEVNVDLTEKIKPEKEVTLDPEEVGEEYVYNASDDGVYGYGKFSLSIKETKTKFTVTFISEGETVYVETNVPMNGSCSYKGSALFKEGYVFSGWNPQPINVERDLKCIAQWEEDETAQKQAGGAPGGGHTISKMTWNDVMAHPDYIKLGDVKTIYWAPFTFTNGRIKAGYFLGGWEEVICIFKNERNSNTTWMFRNGLDLSKYIDNTNGMWNPLIDGLPEYLQGKRNSLQCRAYGAADGSNKIGIGNTLSYKDTVYYDLGKSLASAIKECGGIAYPGQNNLNFISVDKRHLVSSAYGDSGSFEFEKLGDLWLLSNAERRGETEDQNPESDLGNKRYSYMPPLNSNILTRSVTRSSTLKTEADEQAGRYQGLNVGEAYVDEISLLGMNGGGATLNYFVDYLGAYWHEEYINSLPNNFPRKIAHNLSSVGIGQLPTLYYCFCL